MSEKVTNDAAAYIRSLAERWGRNADWAERAVRSSVSVSADEALRLHVIDLVAASRGALIRALDGRTVHAYHVEGTGGWQLRVQLDVRRQLAEGAVESWGCVPQQDAVSGFDA